MRYGFTTELQPILIHFKIMSKVCPIQLQAVGGFIVSAPSSSSEIEAEIRVKFIKEIRKPKLEWVN